jgi:hypothetical protein
MNLVLKTPNETPCQAGKDFSVLIWFDDADSAGRADDLLQRLNQNLKEEEGRLFHQWWGIEVLACTLMRELAALEAATTDMIIIAIHEAREWSDLVAAWMRRLLDLRNGRPGALVVMLDSAPAEPDTSRGILSQLKQAAELGQMDFFATQAEMVSAA